MKELLKEAYLSCMANILDNIPKTKRKERYIDIEEVKPIDLISFMEENDIPPTAWFDNVIYKDDEEIEGIYLTWSIQVPLTKEDIVNHIERRFNANIFKYVYNILTKNGFTRLSSSKVGMKSPYNMFKNQEHDKLVEYYSLRFELDE